MRLESLEIRRRCSLFSSMLFSISIQCPKRVFFPFRSFDCAVCTQRIDSHHRKFFSFYFLSARFPSEHRRHVARFVFAYRLEFYENLELKSAVSENERGFLVFFSLSFLLKVLPSVQGLVQVRIEGRVMHRCSLSRAPAARFLLIVCGITSSLHNTQQYYAINLLCLSILLVLVFYRHRRRRRRRLDDSRFVFQTLTKYSAPTYVRTRTMQCHALGHIRTRLDWIEFN